MSQHIRVLIVEDSEDDCRLILRQLRNGGFEPDFVQVDTELAMKMALEGRQWDLVLSDFEMVQFDGFEAISILRKSFPDVPLIIVSGVIGEEVAVRAMKLGANDYIMKGNLARLVPAIQRELREAENRRIQRVTEDALRLSEERLRQAEKMESIGRLASGVAHDFNNILTVIGMDCDSLLKTLPAGTPGDSMRHEVLQITKAHERAARLTRQLLAFSRKRAIQPRPVEIRKVVSELEEMLRRLIGAQAELKIEHADGAGAPCGMVEADPNQIEQIVMNLVINAKDAVSLGGKVTVRCQDVVLADREAKEVLCVEPGRYALISVRDDGCGMDPETRARVFEPFFTTKGSGKGTGLGLATVYGIVRQNRGAVSVCSDVGKGTEFKVFLPLIHQPAQVSNVPPSAFSTRRQPQQNERAVLLAEDEETLRSALAKALSEEGYRVVEAIDGGDAMEKFRRHFKDVNLLITDFVMPGMNGRDLSEEILAIRRNLKVLFLSGYGEAELSEMGLTENEVNFLEKPFTQTEFVQKVRALVSAG